LTLRIQISRKGKLTALTLIGRINAKEVVELEDFSMLWGTGTASSWI